MRRRLAVLVGIAAAGVAAFAIARRAGWIGIDAIDGRSADARAPGELDAGTLDADGKPTALAARPSTKDAKPVVGATRAGSVEEGAGIAYRALVVDEEGRPLRGAVVRVDERVRELVTIVGDASPVSSADGRVTLTADPRTAGRYLWARASLAGRVQQQGAVALERGQETRIVLVPSCPLRLRVVDDARGAPVAGVTLRVVSGPMIRAAFGHGFDAPASDEATTDADGRATLATEGGPAIVYVMPKEHAATTVRGITVPREGVDVEVRVARGGTLAGHVTDAKGAAVAGATVQLDVRMAYRKSTTTDADGRYRLGGVPVADAAALEDKDVPVAEVIVSAAGRPATSAAPKALPLPGETETLDIALEVGGRIEGRIVGAGDVAVLRLRVMCWSARNENAADVWLGADGRFVAGPLRSGTWSLTVEERGSERTLANVRQEVRPGEDVTGVEIRLADRSGALAVRVADADGRPVANTEIEARAQTGQVNATAGSATTGADGRARIDGLPREGVAVTVRPPDSAPFGRVATAEELAGASEFVITLPDGESSGKALRLDGSPARVRLRLSGSVGIGLFDRGQSVATEADGSFRFCYLSQGRIARIHADGEDFVVLPDNLGMNSCAAPGNHYLRLLIATRAEVGHLHIAATLRDAKTGAPVPAVVYECAAVVSPPGDEERYHYLWHGPDTDEQGRFLTMEALAPDTYDVRFAVPGYRSVRIAGLRLPWTGEPPTIRLERGARLRGVVRFEEGEPVDGATVSIGDDHEGKTDEQGRYSISGLDAGVAETVLRGTYILTAKSTVSLGDDGEAALDFRAVRAGAVLVRFKGLDLSASGGINVDVKPVAGGEPRVGSTSIEGAAQSGVLVPGIPPGAAKVVVSRMQHVAAPLDVVVRPGETVTVDAKAP